MHKCNIVVSALACLAVENVKQFTRRLRAINQMKYEIMTFYFTL